LCVGFLHCLRELRELCIEYLMQQPMHCVCRFEAELRDSSKHDSWQREAVAADLAARAAAVRQRRDDMAATQEAAIHARQQLVQQNLQAGQQLKVTNPSWLEVQTT